MENKNYKVQPKTLPGFMELLPDEQIKFNYMIDKIRSTYEKYGFLTELLNSKKFYQNAFDTAVNYELLMELKKELM